MLCIYNNRLSYHRYAARYILTLKGPHTVKQLQESLDLFDITISDEDAETLFAEIIKSTEPQTA